MGFQKDFLWGAASAAHQIEGAYLDDGKGLSIWDALIDGKVAYGENARIACDHYHRYLEDVSIMKSLGLKSYRFSVSWARIFPDNSGVINEKGLEFYRNLVDELTRAGIEPMCTLYHWDLPMWLHDAGGWANEEIIFHFARYAEIVVNALSDKVRYWFTFNEPQCFVYNGYVCGGHAPFLTESRQTVEAVTRNVMLAHGRAVQKIKEISKLPPLVGFAPTADVYIPASNSPEAIEIAKEATYGIADPRFTRWWSDPIVLGQRPDGMDFLSDEDLAIIHQPLDFYAYNVYTAADCNPDHTVSEGRIYEGMPRTTMDWAIEPECLYWSARFLHERYKLPILVAENGMANVDFVMRDGKVHDPQRTEFLIRYLRALKKAAGEGIPVIGYQYWSLMDNFEWTCGFCKRFGLIYVDYRTGERIVKDSAYDYAEIIRTNGDSL